MTRDEPPRPEAPVSRPRCPACQRPLERGTHTVLDDSVAELWWCKACRMWWGGVALSDDTRQDRVRDRFSVRPAAILRYRYRAAEFVFAAASPDVSSFVGP